MENRNQKRNNLIKKMDEKLGITGILSSGMIMLTVVSGGLYAVGYDWPTEPFSVIGESTEPVATLFNIGLVLGGVLGVGFSVYLYRSWSKHVGVLYSLVGFSFVFAGAFTISTPLHEVAAGVFIFSWLAIWSGGVVDWKNSNRDASIASFIFGSFIPLVWLPYDLGMESAKLGMGFTESVTFVSLSIWTIWIATRLNGLGIRNSTTGKVKKSD